MNQQNNNCQKKQYQKLTLELKLFIIDQIHNGRISVNHAANKYNVSRSSITYWINKYSTMDQKNKTKSKNQQIKKLLERIEELELLTDLQQDLILEFEDETGLDIAKKSLPDSLNKKLNIKRQNRSK